MERVVNRLDLDSKDGSPPSSPDPPMEDYQQHFDFVMPSNGVTGTGNGGEDDVDGEDLDFRLFSAPKQAKSTSEQTTAQRIRLRSPSMDNSHPGFLGSGRRQTYYLATAPSPVDQEKFHAAAMTGQQVHALSRSHCPGSEYSWKVLSIPRSHQAKDVQSFAPELFQKLLPSGVSTKRTRPGKKYRIRLRTKKAAALEKTSAAKAAAEAKEVAEREKRTQRNREKKVKKKMREKAKKHAGAGEEAEKDSDASEET
ncbi:uncharacterized protein LTR77_010508 [Saxophila tyrrhenica]|uniref:Uncharacterized protein n=1 Tax=Saxophila tyrrhenica TaxID=1690608 RepID=A0AAV9NVC8_9PEZI|nr:hypothetical protein LTR77_010508 [Saxophila tyrrhenica]